MTSTFIDSQLRADDSSYVPSPRFSDREITSARIPSYGRLLLSLLNFSQSVTKPVDHLSEKDWQNLLRLSDEMQLTLLLGRLAAPHLPRWVQKRIDRNYQDNQQRFKQLTLQTEEICATLSQRNIDFVVLKGYTHAPHFTPDPAVRSQGDIDIWCQPQTVLQAQDALRQLGYKAIGKAKGRHLDPMMRDTAWQWTGDYYAPDLPIPVDLHYQLWDAAMEEISGPDESEIWARRCRASASHGSFTSYLDLSDTLAFASLHVLMHLLHGDLRLQRAWELAFFMQQYSDCDDFWHRWQSLYPIEVRQLQLVPLALSYEWFGCQLPELIREEIEALPANVLLWLKHYGMSPVESLFTANKDELWLNLSLLQSAGSKFRIFFRRLTPLNAALQQTLVEHRTRTTTNPSPTFHLLLPRAWHHTKTFPLTCWEGVAWWLKCRGLGRQFLLFALASGVFDFGEFVFFLLYNLYLLGCGFDEKSIGQIAAAVTVGTFVGALPAALLGRRFGLRTLLLAAVIGTAGAGCVRALFLWPPALLASGFLNGVSMSFWAVSLAPAVTSLTSTKTRTFGMSVIASIGIGVGALAGLVGGRLPTLAKYLHSSLTEGHAQRIALLTGCAVALLAILPVLLLNIPSNRERSRSAKTYPRGRFIYAFLGSLFVWCIGTGGFNPFFNVYFASHLHAGVQTIGFIFSLSQMMQVFAVLLAPALLRSIGEVKGIAVLQVMTAITLALLACLSTPLLGAAVYIAYMSFQYSTEPCLLSMLMTGVDGPERKGASALNFTVISLGGALAAAIAGAGLQQFGYRPVLLICALLCAVAAAIFYRLFQPPTE